MTDTSEAPPVDGVPVTIDGVASPLVTVGSEIVVPSLDD